MTLPIENPPLGWKARATKSGVTLTKSFAGAMGLPSGPVLTVSAVAIFGCMTVFRVLTAQSSAAEVLLSAGTFVSLAMVAGGLAVLLRIQTRVEGAETLTIEPGRIIKSSLRLGEKKMETLEKNRVLRVIHSRPRNPDGTLTNGGSVELEYRAQSGTTEEFYVMWATTDSEVLWFVQLMEAWTGQRARVEDYVIDSDEDDEGDDADSEERNEG